MVTSLFDVGLYNLTFKEKTSFCSLQDFLSLLFEQLNINLPNKQIVE
jgi:hypothetical protein